MVRAAVVLMALLYGGSALPIETATPGAQPPYGWKDGVTLAIAVLGILNYWNTISERRVRVIV